MSKCAISAFVVALVSSCSSEGEGDDGRGGWFVFSQPAEAFLMGNADRHSYHFVDRTDRSKHAGNFDPATIETLSALLTDTSLRHYYQFSQPVDDSACNAVGYTMTTTQGSGCWMPQAVTDEQTSRMLEFMIELYKKQWYSLKDGGTR